MEKIKKYGLYIVLLCLYSGLMLSCSKEAIPADEYAGSTANVVLTVSRAIGSGVADAKEGIMKMRVIVASVKDDNTEVLYRNLVFTDNENTNAQTYTVNLQGVPKGTVKFYIVCNEESLPSDVQRYLSGLAEGVSLAGLAGYVVQDASRTSFPKTLMEVGAAVGIPITGISQPVTLEKKIEKVDCDIQYMVAKITVNLTNNTSSPITHKSFNFSSFLSDRAYLFPQTGADNVVPLSTNYIEKTITVASAATTRPGTKTEGALNVYVYPSAIGSGNYKVGLTLNDDSSYEKIDFFREAALDRGMYAELNGIFGNDPEPEFSYTVNEWEDGGINDVPAFD